MADAAEKRELGATIARAESASAEVVCSMRATNIYAAERGPGLFLRRARAPRGRRCKRERERYRQLHGLKIRKGLM